MHNVSHCRGAANGNTPRVLRCFCSRTVGNLGETNLKCGSTQVELPEQLLNMLNRPRTVGPTIVTYY
jgi:hypothetical protein